jgi:hypothetical protein
MHHVAGERLCCCLSERKKRGIASKKRPEPGVLDELFSASSVLSFLKAGGTGLCGFPSTITTFASWPARRLMHSQPCGRGPRHRAYDSMILRSSESQHPCNVGSTMTKAGSGPVSDVARRTTQVAPPNPPPGLPRRLLVGLLGLVAGDPATCAADLLAAVLCLLDLLTRRLLLLLQPRLITSTRNARSSSAPPPPERCSYAGMQDLPG